jgi:uncharacterized protein
MIDQPYKLTEEDYRIIATHRIDADYSEKYLSYIKQLEDKIKTVEWIDFSRSTPLITASLLGATDAVKYLLENGWKRNINFRDKDGFSALHAAAMGANVEVVKLLIDSGADLEVRDKWGNTPLWRSTTKVIDKGFKIVFLLLESGSDIHNKNDYGADFARSLDWEYPLLGKTLKEIITDYEKQIGKKILKD